MESLYPVTLKEIYIPISLFAYTKRARFRISNILNHIPKQAIVNHLKEKCQVNVLYGVKYISSLIFKYFEDNKINLNNSIILITKYDLITYFDFQTSNKGNYITIKE